MAAAAATTKTARWQLEFHSAGGLQKAAAALNKRLLSSSRKSAVKRCKVERLDRGVVIPFTKEVPYRVAYLWVNRTLPKHLQQHIKVTAPAPDRELVPAARVLVRRWSKGPPGARRVKARVSSASEEDSAEPCGAASSAFLGRSSFDAGYDMGQMHSKGTFATVFKVRRKTDGAPFAMKVCEKSPNDDILHESS